MEFLCEGCKDKATSDARSCKIDDRETLNLVPSGWLSFKGDFKLVRKDKIGRIIRNKNIYFCHIGCFVDWIQWKCIDMQDFLEGNKERGSIEKPV